MAGRIAAKSHLDAVDAVHRGISSRGTSENLNPSSGQEAQMREVMADLFGEVNLLHDPCVSNAGVAQSSNLGIKHIRPT